MTNRKSRILLIDDHPVTQEGLTLLIKQQADLDVCGIANTGRSALQAIKDSKPDVVIVDLSFDYEDSVELIKKIAGQSPGLPVLVLSLYPEQIYVEHLFRAGARGYVLKQDPVAAFFGAIRQVLKGRIYVSEKISATFLERYLAGLSKGESARGVESLSSKEFSVLQLIGEGMTTRQIAEKLMVSIKTVETYRARIKVKLDLKMNVELLRYAVRREAGSHEI